MRDAEHEKLRVEALRYIHDAEKRGIRVPRSRKFTAIMDRLGACRYCGSKDHDPLPMLKWDVWLKAVSQSLTSRRHSRLRCSGYRDRNARARCCDAKNYPVSNFYQSGFST
jgi:hypothetical protein